MECKYLHENKVCYTCKIEKPVTEFNQRKIKGGYTYKSDCKICEKNYQHNLHVKEQLLPMYIELEPDKLKTCNRCNETKQIINFSLCNTRTGLYYNFCKHCQSISNKEYEKKVLESKKNIPKIIISEKKCSCCDIIKPADSFCNKSRSKDGKSSQCRECSSSKQSVYRKENKELISESAKLYRENNIERLNEKGKKYRESPEGQLYHKTYRVENKEKLQELSREYEKNNKAEIRAGQRRRERERRKSEPHFLIRSLVKANLLHAFKNYSKNGKTKLSKEYGIEFKDIYAYVGPRPTGNFHLDHIIPVCIFDFDNSAHVRLAHIPENLRWIPGKENILKRDKIIWSLISANDKLLNIAKILGLTEEHDGMDARELRGILNGQL